MSPVTGPAHNSLNNVRIIKKVEKRENANQSNKIRKEEAKTRHQKALNKILCKIPVSCQIETEEYEILGKGSINKKEK